MNNKTGLTTQEVNERIAHHQVNITNDSISKTKKQIVKEHTLTYFNFLNLFLALLIIISGQFLNLTFIAVVFVNTVLGIFQEFKVKSIIDQLSVVTVKKVKVIRDGNIHEIPVEEMVMDDLIFVEAGNQIGADCEVIESHAMEINESLLTGESKPVKKHPDDTLFAGTFVVAGSGYAKVVRVGSDNYSTKLVAKAKHQHKASSEMRDSIEKVIKVLSIIIIPVGILLFQSQLRSNPGDVSTAIVKTVGGVVGMIPEGLVLLTSLSFVIGVGRLAGKKALVQQMEAIEALSRVDVLCLDKTGTITTGELQVRYVVPFEDNGYSKQMIDDVMGSLAHASEDANVTQQALMDHFKKNDLYHKLYEIPFSSERKYRAIAFDNHKAYILGAPEFLIDRNDPILKTVEEYSELGLRVLMLGECASINVEDSTYEKMTPMALIAISDVIKPDARDTFAYFEKQGVSIRILSGDNPMTVSRVCMLAGLTDGDRYIDASTLPDDPEEMAQIIGDYRVFGRVKPEQKQLIIKAFQKQDHIVGMVGDGVNDVLAIKDADCGIAMAAGADAAKQAAHIVLLDSNFSSMKSVVKEGRTIIANIERVSSLYLTKTIYSTFLSLFFGLIGLTYPFTPFQLSLISGFAIGLPSLIITLEQDVSLNAKGFLSHVIHTALPCALTVIFFTQLMLGVKHVLGFDAKMYSTYCFLITSFVSFIVLYRVSLPFEWKRMGMGLGCVIVTYVILFFFPHYFKIVPFSNPALIGVIPLCLMSIFMARLFTQLVDKIEEKHVFDHLKERFGKSGKKVS